MAGSFDDVEKRMARIRTGWSGQGPEPGTPAFGERAKTRLDRLRQASYQDKYPVASPAPGVGKIDTDDAELEAETGAKPKLSVFQQGDVLKKAGE